jgi:hypothetical protein
MSDSCLSDLAHWLVIGHKCDGVSSYDEKAKYEPAAQRAGQIDESKVNSVS